MDSTLATIMYYLLHILAVFGLVFLLILLVRVTLWCLMCNLKRGEKKQKHQKTQNQKKKQLKSSKLKPKSIKQVEEGQAGDSSTLTEAPVGPPTLRRSPNVQRLNLIIPEDDQLFKDGMEKKKKESSSSEEEIPPTPPPPMDSTAIEIEEENSQSTVNPVYATLAFTATTETIPANNSTTSSTVASRNSTFSTPKRKAPSPPVKRIAHICPFCSSMNKAKEEAVATVEEEERKRKAAEIKSETTSTKSQDEVVVTLDLTKNDNAEVVEDKSKEIQKEKELFKETPEKEVAEKNVEEDEELPPLPETPQELPSPLASSTESLEQNALNSLDQAIEELDDVVQDLNEVEKVNGDNEEEKGKDKVTENQENGNKEEVAMVNPPSTTVVTVEINAVIKNDQATTATSTEEAAAVPNGNEEKKSEVKKVENSTSEDEKIEMEVKVGENADQQTDKSGIESTSAPTEPTESSVVEPKTAADTNTTITETLSTSSTEKIPSQELLKKQLEPKKTPSLKQEEPEIAFIPPKPSEIKKRESLRRRQQQQQSDGDQQTMAIIKPRIIESVSKVNGASANQPPLPYKPIRLVRTVSAPMKKQTPTTENTNGFEPQCAIYARVIDQIKQRVSYVEPSTEEKSPSAFDNEEEMNDENWDKNDKNVAQQIETVQN